METIEYIVGEHGEKKAIIIPLESYEELMEDLHDLKIIAERKHEGEISLKDLKKRLSEDGILG
jgi:PHD/YefM family antitoxin component YafN of YafNO toxin-antitoxin module